MPRVIKRTATIGVIVVAAAQVVRPVRMSPPIDANRAVRAMTNGGGQGLGVIDRSCRDCHSNETSWPWYSHVAPASWLIVRDVNEGRKAVNFSEWASYRPEQRRKLLKESCDEVREGEMPPLTYTALHRTAKLTPADVQAICELAEIELARSGAE